MAKNEIGSAYIYKELGDKSPSLKLKSAKAD
jgi:hypothetical protein